jgi:hypothetical protein
VLTPATAKEREMTDTMIDLAQAMAARDAADFRRVLMQEQNDEWSFRDFRRATGATVPSGPPLPMCKDAPKRHGPPLGEGATPAMTRPVDASCYTMSRRTTKPRPDILIDDLYAAVNKMYPEGNQSRPDQALVRQYQ